MTVSCHAEADRAEAGKWARRSDCIIISSKSNKHDAGAWESVDINGMRNPGADFYTIHRCGIFHKMKADGPLIILWCETTMLAKNQGVSLVDMYDPLIISTDDPVLKNISLSIRAMTRDENLEYENRSKTQSDFFDPLVNCAHDGEIFKGTYYVISDYLEETDRKRLYDPERN